MELLCRSLFFACLVFTPIHITKSNPKKDYNALRFKYLMHRNYSSRAESQSWKKIVEQTHKLVQCSTPTRFPSLALLFYLQSLSDIQNDGGFTHCMKVRRKHLNPQELSHVQCTHHNSISEHVVLTLNFLQTSKKVEAEEVSYFNKNHDKAIEYIKLLSAHAIEDLESEANGLIPYLTIDLFSIRNSNVVGGHNFLPDSDEE